MRHDLTHLAKDDHSAAHHAAAGALFGDLAVVALQKSAAEFYTQSDTEKVDERVSIRTESRR